jgi:hypothetical protein
MITTIMTMTMTGALARKQARCQNKFPGTLYPHTGFSSPEGHIWKLMKMGYAKPEYECQRCAATKHA